MRSVILRIRERLDSAGILLSGLCAVHCVLGLVLVSVLGLGGGILLAPEIHEYGLMLAIGVALLTLGFGILRHRRLEPLAIGACGITLMAIALAVEHGEAEAFLTLAGVALLATAHIRNLRHAC